MKIPPQLHPLIAQARQQMPQLAGLSDEQLAQMLMQTMQEQQSTTEQGAADIDNMTTDECITHGVHLFNIGRWQVAEQYLLAALDKAEKENSVEKQVKITSLLGIICRNRGDFSQAIVLFHRALFLAERFDYQHLKANTYLEIGIIYRIQGVYPQAIEYYKKANEIFEQCSDEHGLSVGYCNIGIVYQHLGDYQHAIKFINKSLELSIKLG